MTRLRSFAALAAAAALALSACASSDDVSGANDTGSADSGTIVIGSADFPESKLLAEIYAEVLEGAGAEVERKFDIGSREVYLKAIEDGSVSVLPEYTGGLMTFYDKESGLSESDEVYEALPELLPDGLEVLEKSPAEDKDALAVTKQTADSGVASIEDLAGKDYVLGGQAEFETRVNGVPGLEKEYGVTFSKFEALQTGPLTEQKLNSGEIQVAVVFTTQPEIVTNDWVVLEDPKNLFIAQNVVPLVRSDALSDEQKDALNEVSQTLTTDDLKEMMTAVTVDKTDVAAEAKKWVEDNDLG
ncbi:ABC transporter substrate-binding protein [Blastococcus sp. Marseille-P5729]|uniref:ABC transporter substrate-binding protein n=1 Tax=Blastococcus sp. Marseille-P5729 TaxID=2086582 RepID=UPI000D0E86F0|nr:ABC transporter substrate-binding protein [Blastococcus sp. Marseille-P5729]